MDNSSFLDGVPIGHGIFFVFFCMLLMFTRRQQYEHVGTRWLEWLLLFMVSLLFLVVLTLLAHAIFNNDQTIILLRICIMNDHVT